MLKISKSLYNKIERTCSYLGINGPMQCQDTILVSGFPRRDWPLLLERSSVLANSLLLRFLRSYVARVTWPSGSGVGDMVELKGADCGLCSWSHLNWLHPLASRFTASGIRESRTHVTLSCFVHSCLNSLTPRCMVPGSKVCSHLSWIILKWRLQKS